MNCMKVFSIHHSILHNEEIEDGFNETFCISPMQYNGEGELLTLLAAYSGQMTVDF